MNTTSGAGLWGNVGQANYAPAKAAIAMLTVVTAMEMEVLRHGQLPLADRRHPHVRLDRHGR